MRNFIDIVEKEILEEIFDAEAKINWESPYTASFEVNDVEYRATFVKFMSERGYEFSFKSVRNHDLISGRLGRVVSYDTDGTAGKRASRVLGNIVSIIETFIEQESPDILYFYGDQTKSAVYQKMASYLRPRVESMDYSISVAAPEKIMSNRIITKFFIVKN